MKKLKLLLLIIVLFNFVGISQNLEWARTMGGKFGDQAHGIATDDLGNVYTIGSFHDTVDFDPGPGVSIFSLLGPGRFSQGVFVQKLDASGHLVWVKEIRGGWQTQVEAYAIALDTFGNIYITGTFYGMIDFNPGFGIFNLDGTNDPFVLKLNTAGNLVWATSMGGKGNAGGKGYAIDVDAAGNVYTTGVFSGKVDFDPGLGVYNLSSLGGESAYIQKLDVNGYFVWAKGLIGRGGDAQGNGIALDGSGNIYTVGGFSQSIDFDPDSSVFILKSKWGRDIFIHKLDAAGDFVWAKKIGGFGGNYGRAIAVDDSSNIYITGKFRSIVDFDPNLGVFELGNEFSNDLFIEKLDSEGNFVWAKNVGGRFSHAEGISIALDSSNNIYTTGFFSGTPDFNPGRGVRILRSVGGFLSRTEDLFVQKLDSNGDFIWASRMGGSSNELGVAIAVGNPDDVYVAGYFEDTTDFNPNGGPSSWLSMGERDIFVLKLSPNGSRTAIPKPKASQITLYPNPSGGLFHIDLPAGTVSAQVQIADALGKIVHQAELKQSSNQLELTHLSRGIYHLSMRLHSGEEFYGKVVLK